MTHKYLSPTTHTQVFSIFFPESKITDFSFFLFRIISSSLQEFLSQHRLWLRYFSAKKFIKIETEFFDVSLAAAVDPTGITTTTTTPPKSQIFRASDWEISIEICRSELKFYCQKLQPCNARAPLV